MTLCKQLRKIKKHPVYNDEKSRMEIVKVDIRESF